MKQLRMEASMVLDATFSEGGGWARLRSGKSESFADELLCDLFGGHTTAPRVRGCWKHPGTGELVRDFGIRIRCAIPVNGQEGVQAWEDFKDAARILAWPQETVYVTSPAGFAEVLDVPRNLQGTSEGESTLAQPHNWKMDDVMQMQPIQIREPDEPVQFAECSMAILAGVPCNDPQASPSERAVFRVVVALLAACVAFLAYVGAGGRF